MDDVAEEGELSSAQDELGCRAQRRHGVSERGVPDASQQRGETGRGLKYTILEATSELLREVRHSDSDWCSVGAVVAASCLFLLSHSSG